MYLLIRSFSGTAHTTLSKIYDMVTIDYRPKCRAPLSYCGIYDIVPSHAPVPIRRVRPLRLALGEMDGGQRAYLMKS